MEWFNAVAGLIGVLVGGAISAAAAWARSRSDLRREVTLRREVAAREAVSAFLEATENMEGAAIGLFYGRSEPPHDLERPMWHRQHVIEISCSPATTSAAIDYGNALHEAVYSPTREGSGMAPWERTKEARNAFMKAATTEIRGYIP